MTAPDLSKHTDDGRFYTHPKSGRDVPSITNIIGMKHKGAIAPWGYRKCGEFVADNLAAINSLGSDRAAVVDLIRGSPFRTTDASANVGDVVHEWIDRHIKGEEITAEEFAKPFVTKRDTKVYLSAQGARTARNMWRQFGGLESKYKMRWIVSETTVWSETHGFAGTLDWMARVGPFITLGDTKTGNGVYPEVGMQLAALHFADYAIDTNGNQFELPKAERFAVAHIRPRGARLIPVKRIEECFDSFLGLRACFEWDVKHSENVIQYAPKIETPLGEAA